MKKLGSLSPHKSKPIRLKNLNEERNLLRSTSRKNTKLNLSEVPSLEDIEKSWRSIRQELSEEHTSPLAQRKTSVKKKVMNSKLLCQISYATKLALKSVKTSKAKMKQTTQCKKEPSRLFAKASSPTNVYMAMKQFKSQNNSPDNSSFSFCDHPKFQSNPQSPKPPQKSPPLQSISEDAEKLSVDSEHPISPLKQSRNKINLHMLKKSSKNFETRSTQRKLSRKNEADLISRLQKPYRRHNL